MKYNFKDWHRYEWAMIKTIFVMKIQNKSLMTTTRKNCDDLFLYDLVKELYLLREEYKIDD